MQPTGDGIPRLSHGDLTCDNILLPKQGSAVIIDLGAARMGLESTVSRDLFGKLGYFAPEQLAAADQVGDPFSGLAVDGQAVDIFQFGVCLVRAATGQLPFGAGHVLSVSCAARFAHLPPQPGIAPPCRGRYLRTPSHPAAAPSAG